MCVCVCCVCVCVFMCAVLCVCVFMCVCMVCCVCVCVYVCVCDCVTYLLKMRPLSSALNDSNESYLAFTKLERFIFCDVFDEELRQFIDDS